MTRAILVLMVLLKFWNLVSSLIPFSRVALALVVECCIHFKHFLTPKGLRPFFSKNTPNLSFLAQEAQMNLSFYFFALSTIGSCPRLL
jgi:hypothetical protein